MPKRTLYLLLTVIGAIVPMLAFVPWVGAHGVNLQLFVSELFANRISTFFALDLLITACAVVLSACSADLPARKSWYVVLVLVLVGVSAALPLLLYLRERKVAAGAITV